MYLRRIATIGQLEAFQSNSERTLTYLEQVQMLFMANDDKEEKQVRHPRHAANNKLIQRSLLTAGVHAKLEPSGICNKDAV